MINFHIFHIFSLPNLSKILYSWDSILMCMTHLLIYTFIHLVNQSYNSFIDIIKTLFNKNCPVKRIVIKNNKYDKPWITTGLKNACKKNNTLYRRFLK